MLQSPTSLASPRQSLPFDDGAGLSHFRYLNCRPIPHVELQPSQAPHNDHSPSTEWERCVHHNVTLILHNQYYSVTYERNEPEIINLRHEWVYLYSVWTSVSHFLRNSNRNILGKNSIWKDFKGTIKCILHTRRYWGCWWQAMKSATSLTILSKDMQYRWYEMIEMK
jgi:hypothetical protein